METLDGTHRDVKEMPIVSISNFFVALTRFQTWHKDKISLFSFNIFYFVLRLLKTETDIGESIGNVFLLLALAQARFPQFPKY